MEISGSHPRENANQLYRKLTPIGYQYDDRENIRFVGTGFFYYHNWGVHEYDDDSLPATGPYLITNKHVVDPRYSDSPDSLTIHVREPGDIQETTRKIIRLYDASGNPLWREHPNNPQIDIAVVPLDFPVSQALAFHRESVMSAGGDISGGSVSKVIGYPDMLQDFHYLPIMRDALVSSPYSVAFHDTAYFFIDARLHDGMSGSPVIYQPPHRGLRIESDDEELQRSLEVKGDSRVQSPRLLGIHSDEQVDVDDRISLEDIRDQIEGPTKDPDLESYLEEIEQRVSDIERESGLNRVWHARYLDDIIRNTN